MCQLCRRWNRSLLVPPLNLLPVRNRSLSALPLIPLPLRNRPLSALPLIPLPQRRRPQLRRRASQHLSPLPSPKTRGRPIVVAGRMSSKLGASGQSVATGGPEPSDRRGENGQTGMTGVIVSFARSGRRRNPGQTAAIDWRWRRPIRLRDLARCRLLSRRRSRPLRRTAPGRT